MFVADFIGRANFMPATLLSKVDDGRAHIRCLGNDIDVDAHPGAFQSESQLLLVRPESIEVSASTATSVVGNTARVISAIFYGASVEYELETESGNVVAVVSDPAVEQILSAGDLVDISFPASRGWLLPAEITQAKAA